MLTTNVQLIQFHNGKVRECVVKNEDDSYTIFLESTLSKMELVDAYNHAIRHILENDFDKTDVNAIEYYAHLNTETHPA